MSEPRVSIVLPTFNRGDVIRRAIDSVRQQSFTDWELVIVDDGSTDGTAEAVSGIDPRIVVVRQENGGVYVARNTGLAKARGRWITFLDSDDEWTPYYLELAAGFLERHPDEHVVTTEFNEAWGTDFVTRQDLDEIRGKHAHRARQIGSPLFQLPAGETDDYLRVYASRAPLGDWARPALGRAGLASAFVYHGSIFRHMAYGYLNWLPITMLTRHALQTVGDFATHTRSAADYHFLCRLARAFPINMIGVVCATKHDRAPAGAVLSQGHLASGIGSYRFETNKLGFFDELFMNAREPSEEIQTLRRFHSYAAARAALNDGKRAEAIRHLREAAAPRKRLWRAYPALAYTMIAPSTKTLKFGFRLAAAVETLGQRALDKLGARRA
jgi:glycosyltransferase involved in cell wall biosynthesis